MGKKKNMGPPKKGPKRSASKATAFKKYLPKLSTSLMFSGMVLAIAVLSSFSYNLWIKYIMAERVKTPLDAPLVMNFSDQAFNSEMLWGSYRPQVYFGLKTRAEMPMVAGLMWFRQFTNQPPKVRHWCEQGDNIKSYGWKMHDGKNFGRHFVDDATQGVLLTSEFVKRPEAPHGGDWIVKVTAEKSPLAQKEPIISLLFYIALDNAGQEVSLSVLNSQLSDHYGLQSIYGSHRDLGTFSVKFDFDNENLKRADFLMSFIRSLDQINPLLQAGMTAKPWKANSKRDYIGLSGRLLAEGVLPNIVIHQLTVKLPYTFYVIYESSNDNKLPSQLTRSIFQTEFKKHEDKFNEKFEKVFKISTKEKFSEKQVQFAQATFSNLIGSIGYFHGRSIVISKYNQKPMLYWPASLYTAVPSRPFFPRGFLWDEGFHNLVIQFWDERITEEIIGHWLDLMNIDGWIPREQILGLEAKAKVPDEFIIQHNENANPPSLFLSLQKLVDKIKRTKSAEGEAFLKRSYQRLVTWFDWFNTTQLGPEPFTYRWRGRNDKTNKELNPKTLTSGLDDYPRASHPSEYEKHLDLRCWMALSASVLYEICTLLKFKDCQPYFDTKTTLSDEGLLNQLHWSPERNRYADYGADSKKVYLKKVAKKLKPGESGNPHQPQFELVRIAEEKPILKLIDDSFGYISLFPFFLKLLAPSSEKVAAILSQIAKPDLLWTPFGLRSLSTTSPYYGMYNTEHDPPYWRGAIWINMNYLALGALHHYSQTGPNAATAKKLYTDLRNNVVNNMFNEYQRTGYVWEQYDDKTGKGKGSHPFTGWSSLVVLIMAEKY